MPRLFSDAFRWYVFRRHGCHAAIDAEGDMPPHYACCRLPFTSFHYYWFHCRYAFAACLIIFDAAAASFIVIRWWPLLADIAVTAWLPFSTHWAFAFYWCYAMLIWWCRCRAMLLSLMLILRCWLRHVVDAIADYALIICLMPCRHADIFFWCHADCLCWCKMCVHLCRYAILLMPLSFSLFTDWYFRLDFIVIITTLRSLRERPHKIHTQSHTISFSAHHHFHLSLLFSLFLSFLYHFIDYLSVIIFNISLISIDAITYRLLMRHYIAYHLINITFWLFSLRRLISFHFIGHRCFDVDYFVLE